MSFTLPDRYLSLYNVKDVTDYIEDFFKIRKLHRCRVRFGVGRDGVTYFDDKRYNRYNGTKSLVPINKDNLLSELTQACSHFYCHIFDDDTIINGVTNNDNWSYDQFVWNWKQYAESKFKGLTYVVDIDSPRIYPDIVGKLDRYDFFTQIKHFNQVTELVGKMFDDMGIEYNNMFSGDGHYFVCESFYEDEWGYSVAAYKDMIESRLNAVDKILRESNNPIQINAKCEGWSRYYKFPFVFHKHKPRISIPLSKDQCGNIDAEWLNRVTDVSNIIKYDVRYHIDVSIVRDIINKANWSKQW